MTIRFYLLAYLFLICLSTSAQSVRINELVASNTLFYDEYADTPDWIELHNYGAENINLAGWTISDDITDPQKWQFPNIDLDSEGYLLAFASDRDQLEFKSASALVGPDSPLKYLIPQTSNIGAWRDSDFNDNNWLTGINGIGYGDADDNTILPNNTTSVFVRLPFYLDNLEAIEELYLHIDYDDGFVAFINGAEVARENMQNQFPNYNEFATIDHEAQIYTGGQPERYDLSNRKNIFNIGENILAIQVHNISETSSDLSMKAFLSTITNTNNSSGPKPIPLLNVNERYLHTNFKLSSVSDAVYLYDPTQNLIDSIRFKDLPTNISIGINSTNDLAYFDLTTPNTKNSNTSFSGILKHDIIFSKDGGTTSPFQLELSSSSATAEIKYTLDASIPNATSTSYDSPISIDKNTVVRAKLFDSNKVSALTQNRTYIIDKTHSLPIISLVTEPRNFFDEDYGIYAFGDNFDPDIPHLGANFWEDWERPIHVTFTEETGTTGFAFDGEVKIFGGWSRSKEQRSLSLFARKPYGVEKIDYPLFPNLSYSSFTSMVLRNSGNDWLNTNIRDVILTGLMIGSGLDFARHRSVVTYLNGDYWGMYNLREKLNEDFLASKYNVNAKDITILQNNAAIVEGNNQSYTELINFISVNSLQSSSNYAIAEKEIDIENYIMYQIAQIYVNNRDWPGNNIKYWKAPNSRWKWILYDTDFGFGIWNNNDHQLNTLTFATQINGPGWPNPTWSTLLFRKLLENRNFKNKFINQFADELNSRFLPLNVSRQIDAVASSVQPEIEDHYDRWNGNYNYWNDQIQNMKTFGQLRHPAMKSHIRSFFNLPAFHTIRIPNNALASGYVRINSLNIKNNNWTGDYFESVPIKVTAISNPGHIFSHWEGDINSENPILEIDMLSDLSITPIFIETNKPLEIIINEINYNSSTDHDSGDWIELHNKQDYPVNLSGWSIIDAGENKFTFPINSYIENNGYLVIAKNEESFRKLFPELENITGELSFGLSSDNDSVKLVDEMGDMHDEVNYSSEAPWPIEANGLGYTLELLHPDLNNELPENWGPVHFHGSPGFTNLNTNIIEPESKLNFGLHPNPFSNYIELTFNNEPSNEYKISIYNIKGETIKIIPVSLEGLKNRSIRISTKDFNPGIYYIELKTNSGQNLIKHCIKL